MNPELIILSFLVLKGEKGVHWYEYTCNLVEYETWDDCKEYTWSLHKN
jgi:hypothetical protein